MALITSGGWDTDNQNIIWDECLCRMNAYD